LTTESHQTRAPYRKHSRENGNAIPGAIGPLFKPDGASFPAKRWKTVVMKYQKRNIEMAWLHKGNNVISIDKQENHKMTGCGHWRRDKLPVVTKHDKILVFSWGRAKKTNGPAIKKRL
jgi:hypothetical protein